MQPELSSHTTYTLNGSTIWAEDWQGARLAGKRIECRCNNEEEGKAKLFELEAPQREEAEKWSKLWQKYYEDVEQHG